MIISIFGKKGSGKTVLSKQYMMSIGGRIIFMSPVEHLNLKHTQFWDLNSIVEYMPKMRPGDIGLIKLASIDAMNIVCAQCFVIPLGYTLIIDEIDRYRGSQQFLDAIHYSRHFNINIIANTRRYTDVPRLLTSQSDELCFFQTNEPRDLDYIRQFCGKPFADHCIDLPQYTYLQYPDLKPQKAKFLNI